MVIKLDIIFIEELSSELVFIVSIPSNLLIQLAFQKKIPIVDYTNVPPRDPPDHIGATKKPRDLRNNIHSDFF